MKPRNRWKSEGKGKQKMRKYPEQNDFVGIEEKKSQEYPHPH